MPTSTCESSCRLRRKRPAPMSSAAEIATCATTSALRARRLEGRAPAPPPSLSSPERSRARRIDGSAPTSTPVPIETSRLKARTTQSRRTSTARVLSFAAKATSSGSPAAATPRPRSPPATASVTLSESRWPSILPREAPSAVRTASSRSLRWMRARVRFATLEQTMSRRNPVAARRSRSIGRALAVSSSRTKSASRPSPCPFG